MGLPVIDVAPLVAGQDAAGVAAVGRRIDRACREIGFFLIEGHGIPPTLLGDLEKHAPSFFAQPQATKQRVAMEHGGSAWRGWFPLGGELTSGVPDGKEDYYFGLEHGAEHPRVAAGVPLRGANLFPTDPSRREFTRPS